MLFTPVIWAGKGSTWNEGRHSARAVTGTVAEEAHDACRDERRSGCH